MPAKQNCNNRRARRKPKFSERLKAEGFRRRRNGYGGQERLKLPENHPKSEAD
jgi:hypothetical protein